MSNICEEEKALQRGEAKIFHLLSDNYLIPILLFLALAFDLMQVSLQDKHKITSVITLKALYFAVMCLIRKSLSFPYCCIFFLLSFYYALFDAVSLSPTCSLRVCVCAAYMPLDTFAGLTQMPVEQGASPRANCTYF